MDLRALASLNHVRLVGPRCFFHVLPRCFHQLRYSFDLKMSRVRYFSCHAAMPHFFHFHPPQLDLLDDSTEAVLHHHAHSSLRCVRAFVLSSSWNYNLRQQEVHDPPWKESGISINLQWYGNTTWRNEVWLPNKTSKSRSFHVHDRYMKRTTFCLSSTFVAYTFDASRVSFFWRRATWVALMHFQEMSDYPETIKVTSHTQGGM